MSVRNSFLDPVAILHPAGGLISSSTEIDQYLVRLTFSFGSIGTWSMSVFGFFCFLFFGIICLVSKPTDRMQVFTGVYFQTYRNPAPAQIIRLKIRRLK